MTANELYCRAFQKAMKLTALVFDWTEPELIQGPGSVKDLPALIQSKGIQRVLLVTDPGLMKIGLPKPLIEALEAAGIFCAVYDQTCVNPTIQNVEDARQLYLEADCEAIIAFGGGSPMDCAKGCGARVTNPKKSMMQMSGLLHVSKKLPPLFAVPTTAGTGSEATVAAVVTNPETHEKCPCNDPKLRPKYAVLDPALTVGLPQPITSTTGMDALTHAVEAYIGQSNTKYTAKRALEATTLIFRWLKKAYDNGADMEARENMLLASYYAGVAFTRAYIGYVHGIAHNLGGYYNVPHGLANAIILPRVLEYYGESAYARLADLADAAGVAGNTTEEKAKAFIQAIRDMNASMNIPDHFDCIQEADIPLLAQRALKESNPLYPVPKIMTQPECEALIRNLMG
ncbi:MAG: iron-containing alcohol dehydrogenase [Oscillospiraceae bacterium]|nr:iron-containing alcohol dehydrogenase [Oscillospiraceae bacterium]